MQASHFLSSIRYKLSGILYIQNAIYIPESLYIQNAIYWPSFLPSICLSVCPSGCTQGTLYTTTTVYGVLVHQQGAICTTQAQYAPRCTRETMFFWKIQGTLMIVCFGGSWKTHTKCFRLESVRVGHINTLVTLDPVGAAQIFARRQHIWEEQF